MITDALIERIIGLQNPTCVGLDTSFEYLPDDMREGVKDFAAAAERIFFSIKRSSIPYTTSCPPSRCRSPITKCTA